MTRPRPLLTFDVLVQLGESLLRISEGGVSVPTARLDHLFFDAPKVQLSLDHRTADVQWGVQFTCLWNIGRMIEIGGQLKES